ncbi:MAG: hypothetical protein UT65_C0012G0002 [Parcubacteria group bacterium GW2011_GWF2_39_8b]|nr:MAG: hypothetical protein UT65_C0012G0002 [Parcubacteria group bacterium GW2011_GWF2_39_8b]KKR46165.1 MAG: hypothetical protein UT81_C0001G0012 [Parcubacteria group bacterium GW2011_GWA2_40_14]
MNFPIEHWDWTHLSFALQDLGGFFFFCFVDKTIELMIV